MSGPGGGRDLDDVEVARVHASLSRIYAAVAHAGAREFPYEPGETAEHLRYRSNFLGQDPPPEVVKSARPGRAMVFEVPRFPYAVGQESYERLYGEHDPCALIPGPVFDRFVGVGNPFTLGAPGPGERVVDIGCGAGLDCFLAARQVGPEGRVLGVDLCEEMLAAARESQAAAPAPNLEFRHGRAESLPVESAWADRVLSNGALNLATNKARAFQEAFRVLKPGGWLQAAIITLVGELPEELATEQFVWTN